MVALGIALFLAWFCKFVLPDFTIQWTENLFALVKKNFLVLTAFFLIFCLAAFYWINQNILHSFLNSADEHSCYFFAELIRMGKWWTEPHPLSEFFNVVHVGNRDGKWYSVYPPGWPLIWALGLSWNIVDWLNPLMVTLSLIFLFLAGRKVFGFSAAWFGIFLMILTPFFTFTAASYFSHGTCLLMISIFLYAYLRKHEAKTESSQVLWSAVAALAVGYGLNTRYLTMAAIVAPFILYRVLILILRKDKLRMSDFVFAGILILSMGMVFFHNYKVTGDFTEPPNHYDKRWERLGFRGDYSILDGFIYIMARFFYLADWAPPVLIVLYFASLFQKTKFTVTQQIFRFGLWYVVFAYFLYYSWGGNQYGPRYYYEGFPFLALAVGDGLRHWWKEGDGPLKKFLIGIVLVSLATAGYQFYKQGSYFEIASRQRQDLYQLAESTLQKPSIVFIRGFLGDELVMSQDDAVRNSPSLDAKILYAHDLGEKNQLLKNNYPDRDFYIGFYDRASKRVVLENT